MILDEYRHRAKQVIFGRGLQIGAPYSAAAAAAELLDVAAHPLDTLRRRMTAASIRRNSRWAGFIPREEGFRRIEPDELPEIPVLLSAAKAIAERQRPFASPRPKPPSTFTQMMTREELERHPEILRLASRGALMEIAADYLGFLPRLYHVGLWLSMPSNGLVGSQQYHLDQPDTGMLSLFINVSDVTPDNGPFIFYPQQPTRKIREQTDYERRSYVEKSIRENELGRLSDAEVAAVAEEAPLDLCGPSGTAAFVDTSVCMHAGSRCISAERVMFVLRYMPPHRGLFRYDPVLDVSGFPADNVQRRVLGWRRG